LAVRVGRRHVRQILPRHRQVGFFLADERNP
jgi:hypothetical protein